MVKRQILQKKSDIIYYMKFDDWESLEKSADEALKNNDLLKASFLYKSALGTLLSKNSSKEDVQRLKKKLISTNKKTLDPKNKVYKNVSAKIEITKEKQILDEFIKKIFPEDIGNILKIVGIHPHFVINYKTIVKSADGNMSVTRLIVATQTLSPEGHIIPGSTDGKLAWEIEMYSMNEGLINNLLFTPLFSKLIEKKKLTNANLVKYFKKSGIINSENMVLIQRAIKQFFAEDYVSFLHIMVPQFENIFLKVSEELGIDIVSVKEKKQDISTTTRTLSSEHLLSENFISVWGENYCQRINLTLFEPLGLKLRHKIAHGEILLEECSFENSILVLYLYLVLLAKVQRKPAPKA